MCPMDLPQEFREILEYVKRTAVNGNPIDFEKAKWMLIRYLQYECPDDLRVWLIGYAIEFLERLRVHKALSELHQQGLRSLRRFRRIVECGKRRRKKS